MLALGAAVVLAGCSHSPDEQSPGREAIGTKEVQEKLAAQIRAPEGQTRVRRTFKVDSGKPATALPPYDYSEQPEGEKGRVVARDVEADVAPSGWSARPAPGYKRIVTGDLETGVEMEHEYSLEEMGRVWAEARARGMNDASTAEDVAAAEHGELPGVTPTAWSYGIDARSALPLNGTYPATHRELGRMGSVNGNCTGTMVGRRLVLTAAHCFIRPDLAILSQSYTARRDSTSAPYGTVSSIGYSYDSEYTANNCHITRTAATRESCLYTDWALLILPSTWTSGTPGWMGYWIPGTTPTTSSVTRHYGYPMCGTTGPSGCVTDRAYGDLFAGKLSNYRTPDYNGDPEAFDHGLDMSPGHSGGALWTDYPGAGGPYLIGVNTDEYCAGTTCTLAFPNGGKLMTNWLAGVISSARVSYP